MLGATSSSRPPSPCGPSQNGSNWPSTLEDMNDIRAPISAPPIFSPNARPKAEERLLGLRELDRDGVHQDLERVEVGLDPAGAVHHEHRRGRRGGVQVAELADRPLGAGGALAQLGDRLGDLCRPTSPGRDVTASWLSPTQGSSRSCDQPYGVPGRFLSPQRAVSLSGSASGAGAGGDGGGDLVERRPGPGRAHPCRRGRSSPRRSPAGRRRRSRSRPASGLPRGCRSWPGPNRGPPGPARTGSTRVPVNPLTGRSASSPAVRSVTSAARNVWTSVRASSGCRRDSPLPS